ncbi:sorbitol dehydrogenase-like [Ptychodera flava]|uniref:sorbitol dehydrogenase-like n=1 Tax=Ptychodera flava TaxID=63121 RepID=UPI00396A2B9C
MEPKDNLSSVIYGAGDMRLENRPIPQPGENEVLLAMQSVGICGSDLKYWSIGRCGRFIVKSPMVIGHEASGTVIQVGDKVKNLQIGDRVAIEPGVSCRMCKICKQGRYNLCPEMKFCATPPVDGLLCRYYVHPADFCFKLPDHMSLEEGAMMEPLAVAVYGCERGNVTLGSNVLICGAGPVGLLTLLTAKSLGAATIAITDIDQNRLDVAMAMGATHGILVESIDNKQMAAKIVDIIGCSPDVTLECSGSDVSLVIGIYATTPGGSVILIGRGSMEPKVPMVEAAGKEIDIKGVFRYANCYPKALAMVSSGQIDIKSLVTHRFTLENSEDAFKTASDRSSKSMKVIINCTSSKE